MTITTKSKSRRTRRTVGGRRSGRRFVGTCGTLPPFPIPCMTRPSWRRIPPGGHYWISAQNFAVTTLSLSMVRLHVGFCRNQIHTDFRRIDQCRDSLKNARTTALISLSTGKSDVTGTPNDLARHSSSQSATHLTWDSIFARISRLRFQPSRLHFAASIG